MAFTASQKVTIAEIFGIDGQTLDDHLLLVESNLSAETYTAVAADLATWATYRNNFTRFHPTESNKGFEVNPTDVRNSIKFRVATALSFNTDWFATTYGRTARS